MAIISTRQLKQFTQHKTSSQTNRKSFNLLECLPNDKEKNLKCDSRNKKTKLSKRKNFILMTHCEKYLTIWNQYPLF